MSYPNSGALFSNKYKKSDGHPDLKGYITIDRSILKELMSSGEDEVRINISAWNKTSRQGDKFVSLAYDAYKKEEKPASKPDDDGDVPF